MSVMVKPLAEINQHALRVLYRELGIADAARFLRQFTTGFGSYTHERDILFADKSLQEIIAEIQAQKDQRTETP